MVKKIPQPASERLARLRVIPAEPEGQLQDCGSCRNQPNCWAKGIKEEHIITNLLVCRIKRNIELNKSAKLFLVMMRPILKKFAKKAIAGTNIDMDVALADMESETIDYLQRHYVMGEIAYPLQRLFSPVNGHIMFFAHNYAKKTRKCEENEILEDDRSASWSEIRDERPGADEEDTSETDATRAAREVIEDGITLTLPEYRVLKFCLSNASEAKRPLNGLHVFLARTMGVGRARVTKVYKDASDKLRKEVRSTA